MEAGTAALARSSRRSSAFVGWSCIVSLVLGGAWQLVSEHGWSVSPILLLVLGLAGLSLFAAGLYARSWTGSLSAALAVFSLSVWFFWIMYASFLFVASLEAVRPPPPGTQWFALVATALCAASAIALVADGRTSHADSDS